MYYMLRLIIYLCNRITLREFQSLYLESSSSLTNSLAKSLYLSLNLKSNTNCSFLLHTGHK